jgi:hypothetical protein
MNHLPDFVKKRFNDLPEVEHRVLRHYGFLPLFGLDLYIKQERSPYMAL